MKKLFVLTALVLIAVSTSSHALDLQEARAQGAVAEDGLGYIKAVKPSTEVSQLVDQVNAGRKAEYERISKENGQPVDVVAKLAAQQIKGK